MLLLYFNILFHYFRVVYLLIGMFCIISWPLSKLLDCLLGKDHGTFYRRAELKVLVDLHSSSSPNLGNGSDQEGEESLTVDEVLIIKVFILTTSSYYMCLVPYRVLTLLLSHFYLIAEISLGDVIITKKIKIGWSVVRSL